MIKRAIATLAITLGVLCSAAAVAPQASAVRVTPMSHCTGCW